QTLPILLVRFPTKNCISRRSAACAPSRLYLHATHLPSSCIKIIPRTAYRFRTWVAFTAEDCNIGQTSVDTTKRLPFMGGRVAPAPTCSFEILSFRTNTTHG